MGSHQLDLARGGLRGLFIAWISDSRRAGCPFRVEGLQRPVGDQEGREQPAHRERSFDQAIY
jgi:hypothetical protein